MPTLSLAIDAQRARDGAGRFVAATDKVAQGARKADVGVGRLESKVTAFGRTALSVRSQIVALAGGFTALLAVRQTVGTIGSFEETLLTLQGVAVDTSAALSEQARQFEALEDAARSAGATTRFSATEAAEGLLFLARAGFDADQAVAALPATLDLAVAGVLDLGEASDIASNVLKQFGLAADETERTANVLVRTANAANTDVRQLGEALKLAGPIAAQAGISLEQTARAAGILGDAGIQASLAGTNLRGVLLGLSAPTSKAEKAFELLGLRAEELNPATNDLTTIFAKLGDGLDDLSKGQRLGALDAIFGRRNASAAAILADSVEKLGSTYNETGRSAAELAALQDSGLVGSFKSLVSAVQEGILQLGNEGGLGSTLKDLVDATTDVVRVFIGMEDAVEGNIDEVRELAALVQGVAAGFVTWMALKPISFVVGLAGAFVRAGGAVQAFNVLLASNPFGLLAVAISSGVAALITFRDELVTFGNTTASISDFARAAFEVLGTRVQLVARAMQIIFSDTVTLLSDGFSQAFDSIFGGLEDFIGDFDVNWTGLFDRALTIGKRFANTQISLLVGIGNALGSLVTKLGDLVTAFNAFDPTRPFESLREVKDNIAFVGSEIAFEIQRDFREAFGRDFVGEIGGAFSNALEVARREIEDSEGIKLPPISELFDLSAVGESISDRAAALRQAREALQAEAEQIKQASEEAKAALAEGLEAPAIVGAPLLVLLPRISDALGLIAEKQNELTKANAEAEERLKRQEAAVQDTADSISSSFGDAFGDVIFGLESLDDAFEAFVKNAIRQLFDLLVTRQLVQGLAGALGSGLSGFAPGVSVGANTSSASGNVFQAGRIKTFASGDIFTRPTALANPSGGTNFFAEAGREEGAFPLTRDSKGDLAVSAVMPKGSRGDVTVIQNITTPDLDGFRQSKRQIARDARDDFDF